MSNSLLAFLLPNLALTAGILAVLVLRKPVRTRFGARMAYALWIVPVLAVAATFLPPRVVEIVQNAPVFEVSPVSGPEYTFPAAPADDLPVFTSSPAVSAPAAIDPMMIALFIWIAGVALMFAWLARRQALFMTDVRHGKAGPAVVGVFRPRIITPSDFDARFDASEQRVILTHETIHLRRQDARINALVALIRCICWYNPLVHIGAHAMRIDQELACDAAVVERHPKARRLYADALLKAQLAARPLPLGCHWPAGAEHPLMERIEMLKKSAPSRVTRITGAALLLTLAATTGLAAWAAMPPTERTVYQDPQQSPAPASAQKLDFSPRNEVRFTGKVVAVNLAGAPPTVQVQGTPLKFFADQPEPTDQVWTLDLTPNGRAPTQDRDLTAAVIGATVDVYAYRMDKTCTANCVIWARNFKAASPPRAPGTQIRLPGVPDRFSRNIGHMIRVKGTISSIVRSGPDNIITVRSTSVVRGPAPPTASNAETGDWRLTQFNGANSERNPFNSQAAVGMYVEAAGLPEENADCRTPCTLAFFSSDIGMKPDGTPVRMDPSVFGKPYDAATMGPPVDRHNDAPSPIAQPGFNAEDYVVVRGTVVRIDGGNPVKTFWVRAKEMNRNYEKTQANADMWRVDRQILPGGAPLPEVKPGMSVRVDGYVSTSCQPECRIQPMLIDLAPQQAAAGPQTSPAAPVVQPIRFDQQAPPAPAAPDRSPFPKYFDVNNLVMLKGKVTGKDVFDGQFVMLWVENAATAPGPNGKEFTPDARRWRVVLGAVSKVPAEIADNLVGKDISVRGYGAKDTSCDPACLMDARDIKLASGETTLFPGLISPPVTRPAAPPQPQPTRFEPQQAAPNPPGVSPDWIPFAKYFDAEKPLMLKGKVVKHDLFDGKAAQLWVEGVSTRSGSAKDYTPDTHPWRVVLGAASKTPADILDRLTGKEVTVRGYLAKDTSCDPGCLMNGRDITLASGEKIFAGTATTPGSVQPAPQPEPINYPEPQPAQKPASQAFANLPDLVPFNRYFDVKSPVLLNGWVRGIDSFEGHAALLIEEYEANMPGYLHTPARDVKIVWRVVLGRLEGAPAWARDPALVGKMLQVRGFNSKDRKCDPECLMTGRDIYIGDQTLPGWQAPAPAPAVPKPKAPPI